MLFIIRTKSRGKLSEMLITTSTDNHCQIFAMCIRTMCPLSAHGGLTLWNIAGSPYPPLWDSWFWVCRDPETANGDK